MRNKNFLISGIMQIGILLCILSCVKSKNFEPLVNSCASDIVVNATFADVKKLYVDETIQIQDDLIIEGYVISSDEDGNFFGVLHFQNKLSNPTEGFQIEIDLRDSHLFYPIGSKISIKLKGLFIGKSKEVYKVGGAFTSFGNLSVGRLPAAIVNQHIFISCESKSIIEPKVLKITEVQYEPINTLVMFENIQIIEDEVGLSFAIETEETERTIIDCNGTEIVLVNSGYSDFYHEILPSKKGSITGVLVRDKNEYQLILRSLDDLNLNEERCNGLEDANTSVRIFISELADPDNNADARFVELYNSSADVITLKGWKLKRYTNDNLDISSTIDLSDFKILAERTFVIAANAEAFISVYGFSPNFEAGNNSPADSNGDDNLLLIDPFDKVVDVFGIIGEDGSNTNHEFENGRAVRNSDILLANPIFDSSEWVIFNDSGNNGTINTPQNAPNDFTPGIR